MIVLSGKCDIKIWITHQRYPLYPTPTPPPPPQKKEKVKKKFDGDSCIFGFETK